MNADEKTFPEKTLDDLTEKEKSQLVKAWCQNNSERKTGVMWINGVSVEGNLTDGEVLDNIASALDRAWRDRPGHVDWDYGPGIQANREKGEEVQTLSRQILSCELKAPLSREP